MPMVGEMVRKMPTLTMLEKVRLVQIFWRTIWQNIITSKNSIVFNLIIILLVFLARRK